MFANALQSRFAGRRRFHGEAFQFQQGLQRFTNFSFIVNDEHRTRQTWISIRRRARNHCNVRHIRPQTY